MGSKCRLMLIYVCFISVIIAAIMYFKRSSDDYLQDLLDAFDGTHRIQVCDVFEFDFDRAYVFNDCYISGDGFTVAYGLDLSISEVKSGTAENIHRIVFVDKSGNLVYEFRYDSNQVNFDNKGVIIHPYTQIILSNTTNPRTMTLHFDTTEYYTEKSTEP